MFEHTDTSDSLSTDSETEDTPLNGGGPIPVGESALSPDAPLFVPGQPCTGWAPSAARVNITDELLADLFPASPELQDTIDSQPESTFGESTPVAERRGRPVWRETPVRRGGPRLREVDRSINPGRPDRRRKRRNLNRRIIYSSEEELAVPEEVDKKKTGLRWKTKRPRKFKFVDDGMIVSKINMETGQRVTVAGRSYRYKHDILTQNMFRRVVRKATSRGMVVNSSKTKLLCISDAQTYRAEAFFFDRDGNKLETVGSMKVLGFHMDHRPSCHAHVEALRRRMRERECGSLDI